MWIKDSLRIWSMLSPKYVPSTKCNESSKTKEPKVKNWLCKTISLNKKGDFIPSKLLLLWCCSLTSCIHTAISFHNHCNFSVFMVLVKQSPFSHLIPTYIYISQFHENIIRLGVWRLKSEFYLWTCICVYISESHYSFWSPIKWAQYH